MFVDDVLSKLVYFSKLCWDVGCILQSNQSVPEAQEGGEEDVGVPGVGVVGDKGPGPSP